VSPVELFACAVSDPITFLSVAVMATFEDTHLKE
jgi:hypothetical protein